MRISQLLDTLRFAGHKPTAARRGFLLLRTFARTMGFYQGLLTLVFVTLVALLFKHFLTAFREVTLIVTEADAELVAMLDTFVNAGLIWLFVLVCIYTVCTTALAVQGARYLRRRAQPADTERE